jgi:outer membrane protein OmpA-like peptidoglycan-associated protein
MADNKTKQTNLSVPAFIDALMDETKRVDAKALVKLMQSASGEKPKMWGPSIIGFGSYHYRYDSGREGDMPLVGFSPRKAANVLYVNMSFSGAKALLNKPEGRAELDQLAAALVELEKRIPGEIAWVLRVDGHTDIRPIVSAAYKSNWELSAARAISVVQHLISKGVSPQRLVAAGFGEFQPIDPGTSEEAYSRNRRIELKLTER